MASQQKVPPRPAGKTLKRPEPKPEAVEASGGEEEEEDEEEDREKEAVPLLEDNPSQAALSTFVAAPPSQEVVDKVAAEDLNDKLVNTYSDKELKLVHISNLRWDTKLGPNQAAEQGSCGKICQIIGK